MRQLNVLVLELTESSKSSLHPADVQLLLSAVRHVQHLEICVQAEHLHGVQEVVQGAAKVLTEQGLQLPGKMTVAAIKEDK
jgi:uncharacterized pyridoxal phosphate-containing UPF0001 family protein